MDKKELLSSIACRGNGEIYLGVVGAVRTGKSTFIKRFIENLVVPSISDEYEKKRCLDEIPQSAQGKTIMTTEPKFVPSNGAKIKVDDFEADIKLVDCVGFVIPNALGYEDADGNPRMIKTPWFQDSVPFVEAAEIGTEKVIKDHSTIGIVVTTDGSFGELRREDYLDAEEKVIGELISIGKPFIIVLNSSRPNSEETRGLAESLQNTYNVPAIPMNVETMEEKDILEVLKQALYEFPVMDIAIDMPEWVHVLPNTLEIKSHYLEKIKESVKLIQTSGIRHEFRTTVVQEFHTVQDIALIASWIAPSSLYLQQFKDSGDLIQEGLHAVSLDALNHMRDEALQKNESVFLRGV